MQTPLSSNFAPFSEKPVFASNAKVRMPNGVVYVSTTAPPTDTVVTTEYRVGDVVDQSFGLGTVTVCATSALFPVAIEVGGDMALPTSVPAASRTELAKVTDCSAAASFLMVTEMSTVALVDETCGVVTRVPVYATRAGFT